MYTPDSATQDQEKKYVISKAIGLVNQHRGQTGFGWNESKMLRVIEDGLVCGLFDGQRVLLPGVFKHPKTGEQCKLAAIISGAEIVIMQCDDPGMATQPPRWSELKRAARTRGYDLDLIAVVAYQCSYFGGLPAWGSGIGTQTYRPEYSVNPFR